VHFATLLEHFYAPYVACASSEFFCSKVTQRRIDFKKERGGALCTINTQDASSNGSVARIA
jgi:hypothetical protein